MSVIKYAIIPILLLLYNISYSQVEPHIHFIESFSGDDRDLPMSLKEDSDGGIILGVQTESISGPIVKSCQNPTKDGSVIFRKYDATGSNLQWELCSPTYVFRYLQVTDTTKTFVGATWEGTWPNDRMFVVRKEDNAGGVIWQKEYGGSSTEQLRDVLFKENGEIILLGDTYSNDGDVPNRLYYTPFDRDIYVVCIDSIGDVKWSKVYGGSYEDRAHKVILNGIGGYYILGSTKSNDYDCDCTRSPTKFHDAYIMKTDSIGNIIWKKCIGGTESGALGRDIVLDQSGGVFVLALVASGGGEVVNHKGLSDYWVTRIDGDGNLVWSNCYGSANHEYPYSMSFSKNEMLWITGTSSGKLLDVNGEQGLTDCWSILIDTNGNLTKSVVYGTRGNDNSNFIYALSDGGAIAIGTHDTAGTTNSVFPAIYRGGYSDVHITRIAPWNVGVLSETTGDIKIYPNPAESIFFIEGLSEATAIAIYDIFGREVYHIEGAVGSLPINISSFSSGTYLVVLNSSGDIEKLILIKQ